MMYSRQFSDLCGGDLDFFEGYTVLRPMNLLLPSCTGGIQGGSKARQDKSEVESITPSMYNRMHVRALYSPADEYVHLIAGSINITPVFALNQGAGQEEAITFSGHLPSSKQEARE